jgi:hypothetical protein
MVFANAGFSSIRMGIRCGKATIGQKEGVGSTQRPQRTA